MKFDVPSRVKYNGTTLGRRLMSNRVATIWRNMDPATVITRYDNGVIRLFQVWMEDVMDPRNHGNDTYSVCIHDITANQIYVMGFRDEEGMETWFLNIVGEVPEDWQG